MVWSPSGSIEVEMVATPPETVATALFGAPVKAVPFSVKVTCPVLPTPPPMVAVNVTTDPLVAFVGLACRLTVVPCPVAGEIFTHQPLAMLRLWLVPLLTMYSDHAPLACAPENVEENVLVPAGCASENVSVGKFDVGAYTPAPGGACGNAAAPS